MDILYI